MALVFGSLYQALREAKVPHELAAEAAQVSRRAAGAFSSIHRELFVCQVLLGTSILLNIVILLLLFGVNGELSALSTIPG
jgi:hypothetical protein